jgi:hypothetical protein
MTKTFIKSKSDPSAAGPQYRTPDHFKSSIFGQGKFNPNFGKGQRFSKTSFKTQHKGG